MDHEVCTVSEKDRPNWDGTMILFTLTRDQGNACKAMAKYTTTERSSHIYAYVTRMTRLFSNLLIITLINAIVADGKEVNLLKGKGEKETAHPYENIVLDPDSQHIPLDTSKSRLRPPAPRLSSPINETTIFVGTVSFRDAHRCAITLLTAMQRAKYRERVTLAVVDQVFEQDERCIDAYCKLATQEWPNDSADCPYRSQIRIDERDARKSRGPSYARYYRQKLIGKEEFCMQVDAHSIFTNNWDVAMIEDWIATENEMGILTTYPHDAIPGNLGKNGDNRLHEYVPHICDVKVGGYGMVRCEQATIVENPTKPIMTALWGGGLVFGKCHSEKRVRVDSYTKWMFDGEEYMRAALLWVSGYDMYSPTNKGTAIYHNYTSVPSKYFDLQVDKKKRTMEEEKGANRIRLHLGQTFDGQVSTKDITKFAGSRVRHLDQYLNFSGVVDIDDPETWQHRCFQQHWIPYEHPQEIEKMLPGWKLYENARTVRQPKMEPCKDITFMMDEQKRSNERGPFFDFISYVNMLVLMVIVSFFLRTTRRAK